MKGTSTAVVVSAISQRFSLIIENPFANVYVHAKALVTGDLVMHCNIAFTIMLDTSTLCLGTQYILVDTSFVISACS